MTPRLVAAFQGGARVAQRPGAAVALSIAGEPRSQAGLEPKLLLALTGSAQVSAEVLTDLRVETDGAGNYWLRAAEGTFELGPARHFLHRDVSAAFYRVLPPFPVPWTKRALWRALLAIARLKL